MYIDMFHEVKTAGQKGAKTAKTTSKLDFLGEVRIIT